MTSRLITGHVEQRRWRRQCRCQGEKLHLVKKSTWGGVWGSFGFQTVFYFMKKKLMSSNARISIFFLFLFRDIRTLMLMVLISLIYHSALFLQKCDVPSVQRLVYHSQMALVVHLVHQQLQAVNRRRFSLSGFNLHTASSIWSYMLLVYWRIASWYMLQTPL